MFVMLCWDCFFHITGLCMGCLCVQTCVSLHLCFLCLFLGRGHASLSSVCFVPFQFVFILSYYSLDARRETERVCVDLDGRAGGEELEGVVEEKTNQNIWYFKICFQ